MKTTNSRSKTIYNVWFLLTVQNMAMEAHRTGHVLRYNWTEIIEGRMTVQEEGDEYRCSTIWLMTADQKNYTSLKRVA